MGAGAGATGEPLRRTADPASDVQRLAVCADVVLVHEPGQDLVALDEALQNLARVDPRKGQVVELRYFGGLSVEETAEALQVSPETVMRDWRLAKAWLLREITARD